MGAAIFIWDQRDRFDGGLALDVLERFPITTFFAPPTAYRMMVQQDLSGFKARALRHTVAAGEAVDGEVIDAWREGTGLHIWEGYGQTESTLMAATFPGMAHKPPAPASIWPSSARTARSCSPDRRARSLSESLPSGRSVSFPATGATARRTPGRSRVTGT